jgi:hypothetical protein
MLSLACKNNHNIWYVPREHIDEQMLSHTQAHPPKIMVDSMHRRLTEVVRTNGETIMKVQKNQQFPVNLQKRSRQKDRI